MPKTRENMENNLNRTVKELCRMQGITMKELANRMRVTPESLSRAINGNPQLSTLENIARNLNVRIEELFTQNLAISDLSAFILFRGETMVTNEIKLLTKFVEKINKILEEEEKTKKIMDEDIRKGQPQ